MAKLPDNPYGLSPKRWKFVQEYLQDLNATQAAVRAGYSSKRADQQGYELLRVPEVKSAVDKEKDRIADELECTRGDILLELQSIAFAKMKDIGYWTDEGDLVVYSVDDIPAHIHGAIREVQQLKTYDKEGNLIKQQVKVSLHNKLDALKTLAQIKKVMDAPAPVVVDNRQVHVKQVIDKYSEALDDVEATIYEVPTKKLEAQEAQPSEGD